jgi:twitching motility protein PilT
MNPDLLWFVHLGIDLGLFTRVEAIGVRKALGGKPTMLDFAQRLIDDEVVADVGRLEKLASMAAVNAKKGPPPTDPFVAAAELVEPIVPVAHKVEPPAEAPKFPFETLAKMDDKALAEGMKGLLAASVRFKASDLHLCAGRRPFIRKDREIQFISDHTLSSEDALRMNTILLSPEQQKVFLETHDLDYALAIVEPERYRVNLLFQKEGSAGSYRMVPHEIKTMLELGFAAHLETLKRLLSYHNGLVLITGPVGSGKTTTLASMVAFLNETRKDHIITVEDPIEVVQKSKGCSVTQIGELRDLETIEMAVSAAETGHLVIGTMHTSDAPTTLNRLLDVFPPAQQAQIRSSVAESLRGIVCQRLLPSAAKGGGLVMACEILVNNVAISNLIRDGKTTGLRNTMETGLREGMCLMDNVIFSLWKEGKVSKETALAGISNRVLRAKML